MLDALAEDEDMNRDRPLKDEEDHRVEVDQIHPKREEETNSEAEVVVVERTVKGQWYQIPLSYVSKWRLWTPPG